MYRAVIAYGNGKLEASERGDSWTVRLAGLEVRARYLDLALAEVLGNASEAHRAAARLLSQLADAENEQAIAYLPAASLPAGKRAPPTRRALSKNALLLGLRVLFVAAIAGTTFMLTTWLSALR
jgi:ferric-dicitrate binding protein FerR (iron transport regulator)